jgi:hypothetical protein
MCASASMAAKTALRCSTYGLLHGKPVRKVFMCDEGVGGFVDYK